MAKSGGDIPEDIITDILSRLPVKSLLRYKSVCKSWLSTISNPSFTKSHLHNAIMASRNIPRIAKVAFYDMSHTDCPVHFDLIVLPRFFRETLGIPQVVGCNNGIICLSNRSMYGMITVYLWNPSIRQCRKVPSPAEFQYCPYSDPVFISFGYDSIGNDYKVLKITGACNSTNELPIIQLYSANADTWTEFQSPLVQNKMVDSDRIVVNGVLYIDDSSGGLISINLHTGVVGLVPFPSFVQTKLTRLLNFEDSVAMLFNCIDDQLVYLWTLDDVSGQMIWTKRNSVEGDWGSCFWLTCYLGAGLFFGGALISGYQSYQNVLYYYEKKVTKFFKPIDMALGLVPKYTESLVSLEGFQQVE